MLVNDKIHKLVRVYTYIGCKGPVTCGHIVQPINLALKHPQAVIFVHALFDLQAMHLFNKLLTFSTMHMTTCQY